MEIQGSGESTMNPLGMEKPGAGVGSHTGKIFSMGGVWIFSETTHWQKYLSN